MKPLKIITFIVLLLLIVATDFWWQFNRALVTAKNLSGHDISDVTIVIGRDSRKIGKIQEGQEKTVRPRFKGESDVRLSFVGANSRPIQWHGEYIESHGGYRLSLTIHSDDSVSSDQRMAIFW